MESNHEHDCAPMKPGRRRDAAIDARILAAARRQLACRGFEGMSLASVAEEACTTRQALYRRWHDKATLAAQAIADTTVAPDYCAGRDPRADLERELEQFELAISAPGHLSLAGTMLQDATAAESREEYRRSVIGPRLNRMRAILEHARALELIEQTADIDLALTLPTGGWYERQLAGLSAPDDWALRTTDLIWRALGGTAQMSSADGELR